MDAGDIKVACEKFEESQKLDPAPGTLLNLADCEERAGRVVLAAEHYKVAAAAFAKTDPRRSFALDKSNATSARIARVTFKTDPALPPDATVHVGDVVLRKFGEELQFDPGPLTVTVEAKGRDPKTLRLDLEPGKKTEVSVDAGPPSKSTALSGNKLTPGPTKAEGGEGSTQRTLGVVGMISGGVVLAAGAAFGIYALDRGAVYGSHCNHTTNACDAEGVDAASSVSWLAPVSTILIVAGGALATTGVVLFLTAPKKKDSATGSMYHAPTVALSPTVGGLRLSGTF